MPVVRASTAVTELTALSVAGFLYMGLAMWATQPSSACLLIEEPRRQLHLGDQLDREHLQRDAGKIRRAARRYVSGLPPSERVDGAAAACEETLAQRLAAAHDVSFEVLRAAISDEP